MVTERLGSQWGSPGSIGKAIKACTLNSRESQQLEVIDENDESNCRIAQNSLNNEPMMVHDGCCMLLHILFNCLIGSSYV
jgi:hypothetical protein